MSYYKVSKGELKGRIVKAEPVTEISSENYHVYANKGLVVLVLLDEDGNTTNNGHKAANISTSNAIKEGLKLGELTLVSYDKKGPASE